MPKKLHEILLQRAVGNAAIVKDNEGNNELHDRYQQALGALIEDLEVLAEGTPDGEIEYVLGKFSEIKCHEGLIFDSKEILMKRFKNFTHLKQVNVFVEEDCGLPGPFAQ